MLRVEAAVVLVLLCVYYYWLSCSITFIAETAQGSHVGVCSRIPGIFPPLTYWGLLFVAAPALLFTIENIPFVTPADTLNICTEKCVNWRQNRME